MSRLSLVGLALAILHGVLDRPLRGDDLAPPQPLALPPVLFDPADPPARRGPGGEVLPDLPGLAPARPPQQVATRSEGDWGAWNGKVSLQDGRGLEDPSVANAWQAEQAWRLPVAGPVVVFGSVGANSGEAGQKDMKVTGRTGLGCKLALAPGAEVEVRGGPGVSYTDPLRPLSTREQANWQVEVQARCPLVLGLGLEYQGTAIPGLSPQERDQINHDLHLAIPVGSQGKVQVGARHHWEGTPNAGPGAEGMELYLGLQLKR